jgi:hypothetical protein
MTFPKLKEGLFPAIGDKTRIARKYDGVIEIDRSTRKRKPMSRE